MSEYSPFDKEFGQISTNDLKVLKEVLEGWYVEYKQSTTTSSAIAKSVSAFANTYGGWIFFGIAEKSKEEPVAGTFLGIARDQLDAELQRIRQAVANHLMPSPHFDTKVLWGPDPDIGLGSDRAVIVLYSPWGPNAPYVHKDGRIYRRVSDSSEPKPENDRFVLDQLWQRSKPIRKSYSKWLRATPELSKAEGKAPYLRVLLEPDLWKNGSQTGTDVSVDKIREIMNSKESNDSVQIPFETVYPSVSGCVARQTSGNDPHKLGLTWRLGHDLRSEIIIPLNIYRFDDVESRPDKIIAELEGFEFADRFAYLLQKLGFKSASIVDLNQVFLIIQGIMVIQDRLLFAASWNGPLFAKIQLLNVWRTCAFVDVKDVLDRFESHGVPLLLEDAVIMPPGSDPETFVDIGCLSTEDTKVRNLLRAYFVFRMIAKSFGVQDGLISGEAHDKIIQDMSSAGDRANNAQSLRNTRQEDPIH